MTDKQSVARMGETIASRLLECHGWSVTPLKRNYPNADLLISKNGRTLAVQVKATGEYGWLNGGSVNAIVCAGGPIFNRVANAHWTADVVVFLSIDSPSRYRTFVVPVADAERMLRRNVDAYFNTPKRNGEPKSKNGRCGLYVGEGSLTHTTIPDQRNEILPYEDCWTVLNAL